MKYHRLVDLNNKCLFHVVLEIGKSKTKVMPDSVSGEDLLPVFRFPSSPYVLTWPFRGECRW